MTDRENKLFEICNKHNADLLQVEQLIIDMKLTSEEITRTAIKLADANTLEIHQCDYTDELVTANWVELFKIFIKYGLMPNYIYTDDDMNQYNIIQEMRYIDNGDIAPTIMRMLMECGGNPNLEVGGVPFFASLDFDIAFDVTGLNNKRLFDIEFKIWLVLMGFGGYIKNHECPVKMKNGYSVEIFKNFEDFDYTIDMINQAEEKWVMHIYNKSTNEEIATM